MELVIFIRKSILFLRVPYYHMFKEMRRIFELLLQSTTWYSC